MSQTDCLYYRLNIESNPRGDLKNKIKEMCAPLYLDDGTGIVMVYPEGAELRLDATDRRTDYLDVALLVASSGRGQPPEFSQEYTIKRGDKVFVLGTIQENIWRKPPSSDPDDCSRIGPGFVSAAEASLQRSDAFPLLSAFAPVGTEDTSRPYDLNPPVVMVKGKGPFVIAKESQRELVARLSWRSMVCIWGGPAAALWGLWEMLIVRPGLR
jgi:hypothetical protein